MRKVPTSSWPVDFDRKSIWPPWAANMRWREGEGKRQGVTESKFALLSAQQANKSGDEVLRQGI